MVQYNVPNCFSGDCDCSGTPPPGNFCPYGDCFSCTPSQCEGEKCCCCASIDIILDIRARCYDRVFFSCNSDGTSPGPGEDPFPVDCPQCFDACDRALGGDIACSSISQNVNDPAWQPSPPDWFSFPPDIGPCECDCLEFVDPNNPDAGCNLTCVTCSGLKCNADVEVVASDCAYQFNLTPSTGCCGTPALTDAVFVIDYSQSMDDEIASVISSVEQFADDLALTGASVRFGLIAYGKTTTCLVESEEVIRFSNGEILTSDVDDFKAAVSANLPTEGGSEPDFTAVGVALQTYPWTGVENLLFLISDEPVDSDCGPATGDLSDIGNPEIQPSADAIIDLANTIGVTIITVQPFDGGIGADTQKTDIAVNTSGGRDVDITTDFSTILDDLDLNVFGASCDCLDSTPIPVELCKGGTGPEGDECVDPDVNVPIGICVEEDNSDCDICSEPLAFNVCGEIVIVEPDPDTLNLVCCSELAGGCTCPTEEFPLEGCCGIACSDIDICIDYPTLQDAINGIWCECWGKANDGEFVLETPNCVRCTIPDPGDPDYDNYDINALENCVIKVPDGQGGYTSISRPQIVAEVQAAWAACSEPDIKPPPSISEASCLPECNRQDECIVGDLGCGDTDDIRDCRRSICSDDNKGCVSVRNPSTTVLNNGIGLVAYESMEDISVIKIDQFNTSLPAKILPNRRTNYGRLQHSLRWEEGNGDYYLVKLYYYDSLPVHFLNGVDGPPASGTLTDTIVFRNGPFQNQCLSLDDEPTGQDSVGSFVQFTVPFDIALSNEYPSTDDVYNVEWFIIDSDDAGLIGSVVTSQDVAGYDFLLNTNAVNVKLELSPHVHDGKPVPVAYPSIAHAHNYMNADENSHFVYVAYQALEDNKWNLYLRQLRLSEYSREEAIGAGGMSPVRELGLTELVYRVVCVTDTCESFGSSFLSKRTATMEITLEDGRAVYNEALLDSTESWSVCSGEPAGTFLKKKVFVELAHSAVVDRCPDQFEFNDIFYNWETGDEFSIPFTELDASELFSLMKKPNDSVIAIGEETVEVSGIIITSSQLGVTWYEDPEISVWVTPDAPTFQDILRFKGLDVSEPIPVTEFETGHCTHPIVKVNTNNEVFIAYECTDPQVHQIHITGTVAPSTSFPSGVFIPKNLDANLDYFLSPSDFKYRQSITLSGEGINQLPDMFIDPNDIIHVAWQSNRNDYWEIYYSSSEDQFSNKRITQFQSKSLRPSISGDSLGNLHIVWHDDRFGNWEIMMAYLERSRDLTLAEQDPYLAGVRNTGYNHYTDVIPLTLTNPFNEILCLSNLFVRFYSDRLLKQSSFDVFQTEFPQAFQVPGVSARTRSLDVVYPWSISSGTIVEVSQFTDAVIDTEIDEMELASFVVTFNSGFATSFIRFRAGDTPEIAALFDEPDGGGNIDEGSGTNWIDMRTYSSGVPLILNELSHIDTVSYPVGRISGRYIGVRIASFLSGPRDEDDLVKVQLNLQRSERICLGPNETLTGHLDLTPAIRKDKYGNEFVESPLPVGINKNQVYFYSVVGFQDNGTPIAFDDPKSSVSCESCSSSKDTWASVSCSISIPFENVTNSEQATLFAHAQVRFYADSGKQDLVAQFNTFLDADGDIECFTIDNESAEDVWRVEGLEVLFGKQKSATLWPFLNDNTGLICGITYWVEIFTCYGTEANPCSRTDLAQAAFKTWKCNCSSQRWSEQFGEAPTNLRSLNRWQSSGDGFSDTRLTETGAGVNNLNPVIRLRSDLTGIVIYESNRDDLDRLTSENEKYFLYGTAFSVFPVHNMFATGAEAIDSVFGEILVQSDVPITACDGSDCNDTGPAEEGRNADFVFDQYDNIFLAAERFSDQSQCQELQEDRQRSIWVHRCGLQASNLVFTPEEAGGAGVFPCSSEEILKKTAPLSSDKVYRKLIRLARVNNDFVRYHITRAQKPAAVVDQCMIKIDIITEPDTIAVRLKNENNAYSSWYPFDPDLGGNTICLPWALSAGSGVKTVTVEAATYQGLSTSFSLPIVADYRGIDHIIKFYRLQDRFAATPNLDGTPYNELIAFLKNNDQVYNQDNLLQKLEGVPVAGIRQPTIENDDITTKTGEFIFIEIIPSEQYLEDLGIIGLSEVERSNLLPTFDVLQQGADDLFAVPTIYDETLKIFKGVFPIQKDDQTFYKDGLSFVIPHFREDCSDITMALLSTGDYVLDKFNKPVPGEPISATDISDVWVSERDDAGRVKYKFDIRGLQDPYFVFGDPNYRLKKQDE